MKKYVVSMLAMGIILFGCSKNDNNGDTMPNPDPDPDPTPFVCNATTLRAEWSLDGGVTYEAAADNQSVTVDARTGNDIVIGMKPDGVAFTVTYDGIEVYSGSTAYLLGVANLTDSGDYVIRINQECATTLTLNVENGPCEDGSLRSEWSLDNGANYEEGNSAESFTLEAQTGDEVRLSVQPNGVQFSVTYEGAEVYNGIGDFILGVADPSDNGDYILNFGDDCSTTITLNVTPVTCDASTIKAEWSFDNGQTYIEAPDDQPVTVDAFTGDEVRLSMQPNGIKFTITYEGVEVHNASGDFILGVVDPSDSGDYIINSYQGCTTTITMNVTDPLCDGTTLRAEWSLDNGLSYIEAPDNLPVTVDAFTGDEVRLSIRPNGEPFTVTYDGVEVYSGTLDYILGEVDLTNSGDYTISTHPTCSTTITLNVTNITCDDTTLRAEWSLDGGTSFQEAPDNLSVTVDALIGDDVLLSMVPNGIRFTVTFEGVELYNGTGDYALGVVDATDSGEYIITSKQGCSTSVILDVN